MQLEFDFDDDLDIDSIATPEPEGSKAMRTLGMIGSVTWKVALVVIIGGCAIGDLFHGVVQAPLILEDMGFEGRDANNYLLNMMRE